jgi:hypothetical protein
MQSGGIQAQRWEGNIHRSLPASTTSSPRVNAKSCPRAWLCSGAQSSAARLSKANASIGVSLSDRRRNSSAFLGTENMIYEIDPFPINIATFSLAGQHERS